MTTRLPATNDICWMEEQTLPNINRTTYALHDDVVAGITCVDERIVASDVRTALAQAYGLHTHDVRILTQVHGQTVVTADTAVDGQEGDALIARGDGFLLAVNVADCCPILLYDSVTHAMAAVHSGWRGTRASIVSTAVHALGATYGVDPANLLAVVGPCAGVDRYEVQSDVATLFPDHIRVDASGRSFLDNQQAVTDQLIASGVPAISIIRDPSCSIADARYHSFRRDGQRAGRSLAYIGRGCRS
jgi:YfiH family protein